MGQDKNKINLSHNLLGCRFDNWMRLKKENHITNKKQARFMTAVSFVLGIPAFFEWAVFNRRIQNATIKEGPIYIVGFWRSGTTFLQNLLTRDPQYGWFDPVRTVSFSNCIFMKKPLAMAQKKLLQGARPMDNLEYTLDLPMEEAFAQATISTLSVSHMLVFPDGGKGLKYLDAAFVSELDDARKAEWFKSYDYILQKVSYLYDEKPLLLKSPENTCRIGALKEHYPKSKFINIYRDPYKVIMSTINMFYKEMNLFCLNEPVSKEFIENVAIDLFERVYRKAIPELEAIPEEDRIDIKYEDFCKNPKEYVRKIYDQLGIGGLEEAMPYFDAYLESQKNYQKNVFHLDPRLRDRINEQLAFYFEYYGYEMKTDD